MDSKIYVLKLEQGKWYVGKSHDVQSRFQQHRTGCGSVWTRQYQPMKIDYTRDEESQFDEDAEVKKLMLLYGIQNVRGGTYCMEHLTPAQMDVLGRELNGAKNCCNKCGRTGHYASQCPVVANTNTKTKPPKSIVANTNTKKKQQPKSTSLSSSSRFLSSGGGGGGGACERCGRKKHSATECYAKKDVNGNDIVSTAGRSNQTETTTAQKSTTTKKTETITIITTTETATSKKRQPFSDLSQVKKRKVNDTVKVHQLHKNAKCCSRCGREGHTATKCYATKDVNGQIIYEDSDEEDSDEEEDSDDDCHFQDKVCLRCGRDTHTARSCYATKDINGKNIKG